MSTSTKTNATVKRRFVIDDERVAEYVARSVGSTDCQAHTTIGLEVNGKIVAGCIFDNHSGRNVFLHFSSDGGFVPRSLLRLVFGYAFRGMKVDRITGAVPSSHVKGIKIAQLCGFQYETKLEACYPNGADMLFFVLREKHCRFMPSESPLVAEISR